MNQNALVVTKSFINKDIKKICDKVSLFQQKINSFHYDKG